MDDAAGAFVAELYDSGLSVLTDGKRLLVASFGAAGVADPIPEPVEPNPENISSNEEESS